MVFNDFAFSIRNDKWVVDVYNDESKEVILVDFRNVGSVMVHQMQIKEKLMLKRILLDFFQFDDGVVANKLSKIIIQRKDAILERMRQR